MKNDLKYILAFSLLAFSACSSGEDDFADGKQQPCNALGLTVSAGDFVTDGAVPGTRATDNSATTTFENNDRVGVIVLEGSELKGNNLPYKYNGSSWSFDAAIVNSEGGSKSVYYYDNKAKDVTYIVYFPYSTNADGVTSIEGDAGLKSKFIPKAGQQSEADYRASDLMFWTSGSSSPQKELAATLSHAYNSVSLLPEVHYTLSNGEDYVHPSPAISDVNFIMEDKIVYPYKAADGSYRCILLSGLMNNSVRCFYTVDKTTYSKDLTVSLEGANTRYSSTQRVDAGKYSLANAQVGDFYCKNNSNEDYLIPDDATSFPDDMNCIGIVFKAGRDDSDHGSYTDIAGRKMATINGYVVALQDAADGKLAWANRNGQYNFRVGTSTSDSDWQGYDNCQKMKTGGNSIGYFPAANACIGFGSAAPYLRYAAPSGSSGWFLPSCGQLRSLYNNRDVLSGQINKLKAMNGYESIGWLSSEYWSSSEDPSFNDAARLLDFLNVMMGLKWGGFYVRGVFAF